jgi:hypothetical protein
MRVWLPVATRTFRSGVAPMGGVVVASTYTVAPGGVDSMLIGMVRTRWACASEGRPLASAKTAKTAKTAK